MNHALWNRVAARVLALTFVAGLAACGEKLSDVHSGGPSANPVSPSAQVIGTAPAEPKGDTPQTTAVAPNTTDISAKQESKNMPLEGQDSSHMTESRKDSQRPGADGDQQTERRAK